MSSSTAALPHASSPERTREPIEVEPSLRTAVDAFSQDVEHGALPEGMRRYAGLMPFSVPEPGQQFAFEVDLDRCSGCKACVTACHNLNGLDEGETWRQVGLLVGGTEEAPFQQTVTAACHHCVEPACLEGCPVNAYEKDPVTGIVSHLDDQCIGCQYCILKCPYDVPQFNERLGIVRKCDMCKDRLAIGEPPACVQACPSEAIAIRIVARDEVISESETGSFIPGAASPCYTLPTTRYTSAKVQPRNLVPANFFSLRREISHLPLVVMLVLTQLSVGALAVDLWLSRLSVGLPDGLLPFLSAAALAFALLALGASTLHLGRPQYAFRALIGLRKSWMSREILAFGLFAGLATLQVAVDWIGSGPVWIADLAPALTPLRDPLGLAAVGMGFVGVSCSVMIYADTHRETWRGSRTSLRFFATALSLGAATVLLTSLGVAPWVEGVEALDMGTIFGSDLCLLIAATLAYELLTELAALRHVASRRHTALKQRALLLRGALRPIATLRNAAAAVGLGAALLFIATTRWGDPGSGLLLGLALLIFAAALVSVFFERVLFFAASVAPRMPGGPTG